MPTITDLVIIFLTLVALAGVLFLLLPTPEKRTPSDDGENIYHYPGDDPYSPEQQ